MDERWRIFLRETDAGSLSKAAASMGQPQSMVSRAVSHLERACGERLVVRKGRAVVVTAFGARLLPPMARLAAEADALLEDMRAARGTPMGDVAVGLLRSAAKRFAGPLAARVLAEMPRVRLHPDRAHGADPPPWPAGPMIWPAGCPAFR